MARNVTITVRANSAAVQRALQSIPARLIGGPETKVLLEQCGEALLARIQAAFMTKSRGGTDEAGDRWAPLSPKTVAYSRRVGRTKTESRRDTRPSQALTKAQQARWWKLYSQGLAMFDGDKERAARRAWAILRREGAVTLFDKYSNRRVDILYNTGELYRSIKLHITNSGATISSNHPAAKAHHNGVPGRLPRRRLWPGPYKWPQAWWDEIAEQIRVGVVDITTKLAEDA